MAQGRVKYYLPLKGYGFVICDEHPDKDIFVHVNDIMLGKYEYLQADQIVDFTLKTDDDGRFCAKHVRRVGGIEYAERPEQRPAASHAEPDHSADSARPYIQVGNGPRQYMKKRTVEFSPRESWRYRPNGAENAERADEQY